MKYIFFISLLILTQKIFAESSPFPERSLDGTYDMNIEIGSRRYTDVLVLKGEDKAINLLSFDGKIKGSLTVPNVFTAPFLGDGFCSPWGAFCMMDFDIVAHENGQSFKVHYKAYVIREDYIQMIKGNLPSTLRGTASLDNGQVLGDFVAIIRK